MRQTFSTACPLDCPDTCSLSVSIDDGRIVKVDADTGPLANPFTQGYICQKVKHHARRVYAPERVLAPLIRTGPKGSGEFRDATWGEATGLIAARIRAALDSGDPRTILPYLYSSSAGVLASGCLTPLLFARIAAPEVEHTICASTTAAAWRQVYGSMLSADPTDMAHAQLVVIWGANPNASNTHLIPLITDAVKRGGAKLVVIDPRRTGVAARADLHLAIRPGTDVVLAYAVARWLVEHDALDSEFIAANVDGADEFLAAADAWTVQRAADICGVESTDIDNFASLVATRSPAMMRLGWGLERNRNGGSGCVGAISMWAVAGHFGVRGSGIIRSTSGAAPLRLANLWPRDVVQPERPTFSMNDVGLALNGELPAWPRTEVLFIQGANPVATAMDQGCFIRGLERNDLFTVVHDQVLTDTATYADVVLPATTHFEAADLAASYGSFSLLRVEPVIDRVGQSRTNDEVAAAIAVELGFPADEFDPSPERLAAAIRTDSGTESLPSLRANGSTVQFVDTVPRFGRESAGRARLFDPHSELPVPRFRDAPQWGLNLVTPATNRTINTMFAEFDPPDVVVAINPDDARVRDIVDGGVVRVFNELGEIKLAVRVDASVRQGVVVIPKGLWRRHYDGTKTQNVLIPRGVNDLGAGACFNDARVEIENASLQ